MELGSIDVGNDRIVAVYLRVYNETRDLHDLPYNDQI